MKMRKINLAFLESVSYEFSGHGGVITYNYPKDKQPDTKVTQISSHVLVLF